MAQDHAKLCKYLTTILTPTDFERFKTIARSHGASPSAYLRGMVVDVIAEEIAVPSVVDTIVDIIEIVN